ncbi:ATP-binding protein [candidate division KSB1 bacterium]|nr:ATP-binding protein [candidate division KSB1 bacterium]RQW07939.1 MAG: ATP-binding protein [candidate division KSB1 bacterium]
MTYKDRKILQRLYNFIKSDEILVIHGSRQVGKTTLLKMLMNKLPEDEISPNNVIYFDLEDFVLLELCDKGVTEVVNYIESRSTNKQQKIFLFIDEIQYLERPSSFLKLFYDHHKERFKLVVSGSSSFNIKSKFKDSLVGRTINFEVFPLDFEEFLTFKDVSINLKSIQSEHIHTELKDYYTEWITFGGYPRIALESNIENKQVYLKQVLNTYIKKDIGDYANVRNLQKFNTMLRMLADQSGSLLNISELSNSIGLARQTVEEYLFILENTYIIKRVPPFFNNVRSELTKAPKIFFEDTGILNLLRYGQFITKTDGLTFENSIYSLLRKNIDSDRIKYWRTTDKKELDFIIDNVSSLIAIEAKLRYTGKASHLRQFVSHYSDIKSYCINCFVCTLDKLKKSDENVQVVYPWEFYSPNNGPLVLSEIS